MIEYLEVGEIVSVHGIRGEVKLYPWTDSPKTLNGVKKLYYGADGTGEIKVSAHDHGRMILCRIEGVSSPEQARRLVGRKLFASRHDMPKPKSGFYLGDLPGLSVLDADTGEQLGEVAEAEQLPANDVYTIKLKNGELRLIPAVKEFVTEVNIEGGYIKLRPIKGMLSDED